jgi:signal transduction histidine kinase
LSRCSSCRAGSSSCLAWLVYPLWLAETKVNEFFFFEVILYGVVLPTLTGLAFSLFAANRAELAWSLYSQNISRNLRFQLNNAHSYDEVAEVLLQFVRMAIPLVKLAVFAYDPRTDKHKTILSWSLEDGLLKGPPPFNCTGERCLLSNPIPPGTKIQPLPCQDSSIGDLPHLLSWYCMPFEFSGSLVARARFGFEPQSTPRAVHTRLLQEAAPGIAAAFKHARLEQLEKERKASLHVEQQRIARDIHDSLGHSLAYLRFKLDQMNMDISQAERETLRREVEALRDVAKEAYEQMRQVLVILTPESGSNLNDTLLDYAEKIGQRSNLKLELKSDGKPCPLPSLTESHIFFIVREALTNIQNHAQAQQVDFGLAWGETYLKITLADDGVGFDAEKPVPDGHFGLANMYERAMEVGAQLEINSQIGHGTQITLHVPFEVQT